MIVITDNEQDWSDHAVYFLEVDPVFTKEIVEKAVTAKGHSVIAFVNELDWRAKGSCGNFMDVYLDLWAFFDDPWLEAEFKGYNLWNALNSEQKQLVLQDIKKYANKVDKNWPSGTIMLCLQLLEDGLDPTK